jgi:chemotaxis signal transduction protein
MLQGAQKSYPSLDTLMRRIDAQIQGRPHPYATDGFEGFLGSQLGRFKRRGRQYLRFFLQKTQFALPMQQTVEITLRTDITPLPNLPSWLLGICNVRGEIISVVDLGQVLGLAHPGRSLGAHLILIRDGGMVVGMLADKIAGTIFDEDPHHQIEKQAPEEDAWAQFVDAVFVDGQDRIHLLAVPQLMAAIKLQ